MACLSQVDDTNTDTDPANLYSELEDPAENQKEKVNKSSPTKSTHSNKSAGGFYEEIDDSKVKRLKEQDSGFEGNYDVIDDDADDNVDRDIKSASLLGLPARSDDESSVMEEFDEVKWAVNAQIKTNSRSATRKSCSIWHNCWCVEYRDLKSRLKRTILNNSHKVLIPVLNHEKLHCEIVLCN